MNRIRITIVGLLTALILAVIPALPASAHTNYCGTGRHIHHGFGISPQVVSYVGTARPWRGHRHRVKVSGYGYSYMDVAYCPKHRH